MSRSVRKTPILGITVCSSEREDKRIWHRRWRAHQRTVMATFPLDDEDNALPVSINRLSNVWDMGKDGRLYWPLTEQEKAAKRSANSQGRTRKERKALCKRLKHKFMGK